ncbi:protein FAM13A isoform X1 [Tachysurus ichikawai]
MIVQPETIFYSQLSPGHYRPDLAHYLEKTIRSAVEQHLFDAHMLPDQSLQQSSETAGQDLLPTTTARQRRRQQKEQEERENRERCRNDIDKENIPFRGLNSSASVSISISISEESERRLVTADEDSRSRKPKHSPTLSKLSCNQGSHSHHSSSKSHDRGMADSMDTTHNREAWKTNDSAHPKWFVFCYRFLVLVALLSGQLAHSHTNIAAMSKPFCRGTVTEQLHQGG